MFKVRKWDTMLYGKNAARRGEQGGEQGGPGGAEWPGPETLISGFGWDFSVIWPLLREDLSSGAENLANRIFSHAGLAVFRQGAWEPRDPEIDVGKTGWGAGGVARTRFSMFSSVKWTGMHRLS